MVRNPGTYTIIFCLILLTGMQAARSQPGRSLPFPDSAKDIIATTVERECPGCSEDGFFPTGTEKIGFGRNFYPHFFTGDPAAGILINQVPLKRMYKDLLREPDYSKLKEKLKGLFAETRLVIIEKESQAVHVTGPPASATVTLTQKLHQCLASTNRKLCCCTASSENECCEKKLGSTFVAVQWPDPLNPAYTWEYRYFPHPGDSKLSRLDTTGKKTELRWCLDSDGPGFLR